MLTVLSLFDGISCGQYALKQQGIKIAKYYASEIDKYAIEIAKKNHPDIIEIGDVNNVDFSEYTGKIDLLIGGSPCQDLSIGKKDREGLKGGRSSLFWRFVEALRVIQPRYFLFENVASMSKRDKDIITDALGGGNRF